jgi:hypothetical protein
MAPSTPASALVHVPQNRPDGSPNRLETLDVFHSTLVPGWSVNAAGTPTFAAAAVLAVEAAGTSVVVKRSILGAVRAGEFVTVSAFDSIIDATDPTRVACADLDGVSGLGTLTLDGCTVIGKVHAVLLRLVSNSIVWAGLVATDTWTTGLIGDRRQEGCVRFSYLPARAKTPRRFECVERTIAGPQPIFFASRYGRADYLKLLRSTPDAVRRGADDGGEMGAFHFVLAPLRETDLRVRLQEYMPVGLEFGILYEN